MPTGYTCDVQSGKIKDFKTFATQCVRAMGVCISMRDDSWDTPIPDRFEPNTKYYDDAIAKAQEQLTELQAMSIADAEQALLKEHEERLARNVEYRDKEKKELKNYKDMLDKVEAWIPPTPEHVGLKEFMQEQLNSSIKFDCGDYSETAELVTPQVWIANGIAKASRDIAYYAEERAKEIERTEQRNKWLEEFRKSLN